MAYLPPGAFVRSHNSFISLFPLCLRNTLTLILLRCDADPAALAKYVLALIKKDKSVDELKESMVSQMDVFLQNETKSFVEMLFTVVDTKEYINPPAAKVGWGLTTAELNYIPLAGFNSHDAFVGGQWP